MSLISYISLLLGAFILVPFWLFICAFMIRSGLNKANIQQAKDYLTIQKQLLTLTKAVKREE